MHIGKHKILILILSGLYILIIAVFFFACFLLVFAPSQWKEEKVSKEALDYLSDRYSADFTILNTELKPNSPGPIPDIDFFRNRSYWELTVESSRFPNDTFSVFFRRESEDSHQWVWSDNYYHILLQEEAKAYLQELVSPWLDTTYFIDLRWGYGPWPEKTGEGISFQEWLDAGGGFLDIYIYLEGKVPEESWCIPITEAVFRGLPNTDSTIYFCGLTQKGFALVEKEESDNMEVEDILGTLRYYQGDFQ